MKAVGGALLLFSLFHFTLFTHWTTHTTSPNDGPLIVWLIEQSSAAWQGTGSWYQWPFFHPYPYTATYSDPFVTAGAVAVFVGYLTTNPIAQHNTFIVLGSISNFLAFFVLARSLWKSSSLAAGTALVFATSFLQLQFMVHLHTYIVAGLPMSIWALQRYFSAKRPVYAFLWAVFFLAQGLNSPFTGYVCAAAALILGASQQKGREVLNDRTFLSIVALTLGICAWYYLPWAETAHLYHAARSIRDTAHFSFSLTRLLWPDVLGIVFFIFGALKYTRSAEKENHSKLLKTWLIMAATGALCMLGPVIKLGDATFKPFGFAIPLPYAVVYYVVPGIQAFRAVTRWSVLLNFGLALALGEVISRRQVPRLAIWGAGSIWLGIMLWLRSTFVPLVPIASTVPPIYAAVATAPEKTLVELPLSQWDMVPFEGLEDNRMLYQLKHHKTLYNGFSGFMPPERREDIIFHFGHFPQPASLSKLAAADIELVLVHFDEYAQMENEGFTYQGTHALRKVEIEKMLEQSPMIQRITCTPLPNDCLYRLHLNKTLDQ